MAITDSRGAEIAVPGYGVDRTWRSRGGDEWTYKCPIPTPPNVPLLRALWYLLDGIWGLLKGSWGVLVVTSIRLKAFYYRKGPKCQNMGCLGFLSSQSYMYGFG